MEYPPPPQHLRCLGIARINSTQGEPKALYQVNYEKPTPVIVNPPPFPPPAGTRMRLEIISSSHQQCPLPSLSAGDERPTSTVRTSPVFTQIDISTDASRAQQQARFFILQVPPIGEQPRYWTRRRPCPKRQPRLQRQLDKIATDYSCNRAECGVEATRKDGLTPS